MSKQTEALKLALEALEEPKEHIAKHRRLEAITTIREALAEQPPCKTGSQCTSKCPQCDEPVPVAKIAQQQEPVAWMYPDDYERMITSETFCTVYSVEVGSATRGETTVALYTSPPASKPWVGLTYGEVLEQKKDDPIQFYRAIEVKLKEKNA